MMIKKLLISMLVVLSISMTGCGKDKQPDVSNGTMRLQIESLELNDEDRFIAQVKSLDHEGGTFEVDITDASVSSDLDRIVGSVLYYSDPAKNNYDPALYLRIENK